MLPIDLTGKRAFVAGVADDNGYGWAIAKALASGRRVGLRRNMAAGFDALHKEPRTRQV